MNSPENVFECNCFSGELSSSWAANLPRFVRRRDALVLPAHTHHSLSSTPDRRNSQDSQISISLRHVSVESRRNSLDSQLSVKIAEMKTKVGRRRTKHSKAKRKARASARKESTPSIESQISRYWLQAVAANNDPSREEVKFSFDWIYRHIKSFCTYRLSSIKYQKIQRSQSRTKLAHDPGGIEDAIYVCDLILNKKKDWKKHFIVNSPWQSIAFVW